MLTLNDICKRLGISRFTAYRLIKSGKLPAKRFAGQWRFEHDDVDRLLTYKSPDKYIIKPDLMTLKEVCAYLSLSRFTIYRIIKHKKLSAVKSGGRWKFAKDDVRRFLTRGRKVPPHVQGMNPEGGILSLSDVSNLLGVTRRTVYRLIKEGKLPATKVAGVWRFIMTEVARYMLDKKYQYGFDGIRGMFFYNSVLDKYHKEEDIYYVNESAYDGFVGNRQMYHDYKTLRSLKAIGKGDKFFAGLHYRKMPVKGGFVIVLTPQQYAALPRKEYDHWSGFWINEREISRLRL
jgi:excisionase family DNA binding protein